MHFLKLVILLTIQCIYVISAKLPSGSFFKLDIIHYNDFHARYEETSVKDAVCRVNNGSCLGGFPRLYAHVRTLLAEKPDALLLNAGDTFQGTYWHTLLKWQIAHEFMNLLPHDAHALGNHEFDDGPAGLAPYLRALKAPVLAANMDSSQEPSFQGTYQPSIIVERRGRRIGIIGITTTSTPMFSNPGKVKFTKPSEAANREAEELTKRGVDIVVLLSHCGLEVDKYLARSHGRDIDIIIGGHTHTLLWNGAAPSGEGVPGPYPVFVETSGAKHKVLIVQASAFTKYMGNLSVYFDERGDYVKWEGGPIFLDRSIPEDPEIKEKLKPYAKLVREAENVPVGSTLTALDAADCGSGECALGNLLTDAMVEYAKENVYPHHYLAFVDRWIIMSKKFDVGTITRVNLFDMYPFLDHIMYFPLQGKYVRRVLEEAVVNATLDPFDGANLHQVAGLRVTYNMSLPERHRVTSLCIGNSTSSVLLEDDTYYHVLTAKFAIYLGKVFPQLMKYARNVQTIGRDQTTLETYIKKHSPLDVSTNGRIVINE